VQELERELSGAADRVVSEECVHVVSRGEERLDSGGPRIEGSRVVVVPTESQVQKRAGSANERRRKIGGSELAGCGRGRGA
jgi:hypothetical protein